MQVVAAGLVGAASRWWITDHQRATWICPVGGLPAQLRPPHGGSAAAAVPATGRLPRRPVRAAPPPRSAPLPSSRNNQRRLVRARRPPRPGRPPSSTPRRGCTRPAACPPTRPDERTSTAEPAWSRLPSSRCAMSSPPSAVAWPDAAQLNVEIQGRHEVVDPVCTVPTRHATPRLPSAAASARKPPGTCHSGAALVVLGPPPRTRPRRDAILARLRCAAAWPGALWAPVGSEPGPARSTSPSRQTLDGPPPLSMQPPGGLRLGAPLPPRRTGPASSASSHASVRPGRSSSGRRGGTRNGEILQITEARRGGHPTLVPVEQPVPAPTYQSASELGDRGLVDGISREAGPAWRSSRCRARRPGCAPHDVSRARPACAASRPGRAPGGRLTDGPGPGPASRNGRREQLWAVPGQTVEGGPHGGLPSHRSSQPVRTPVPRPAARLACLGGGGHVRAAVPVCRGDPQRHGRHPHSRARSAAAAGSTVTRSSRAASAGGARPRRRRARPADPAARAAPPGRRAGPGWSPGRRTRPAPGDGGRACSGRSALSSTNQGSVAR